MKSENRDAILEASPSAEERIFDHYLGSLLGGAIADALGWITEFRKSQSELSKLGVDHVDHFLTWEKPTGGRFHTYIDYVSAGDYSDDTQLLLCTARSLESDGSFDPDRFTSEMVRGLTTHGAPGRPSARRLATCSALRRVGRTTSTRAGVGQAAGVTDRREETARP